MQTVTERLVMSVQYAVNTAYAAARIAAVAVLEPAARSMFPEQWPMGFVDRARIYELTIKLDKLRAESRDSQASFDRYSEVRGELLGMLTTSRIRALATFRGMRDPEEVPNWAETVIDGLNAVVGYAWHDVANLQKRYRDLVAVSAIQCQSLAAATSTTLDCAAPGTWTGDLATSIRRIAEQRDRALAERDQLRAELSAQQVDDESLPTDAPVGTFQEHGE